MDFFRFGMKNGCGLTVVIAFFAATVAEAVPVNLNTWTAESYDAVSGFPPGVWQVSGDGSTVTQVNNGQPTLFYSDFQAINTNAVGRIRVTGGDDDFIGFVLGFDPGDSTSAAADYLLLDWKAGTQNFDFGVPSTSPGGTAPAGLAVSQVSGIRMPTNSGNMRTWRVRPWGVDLLSSPGEVVSAIPAGLSVPSMCSTSILRRRNFRYSWTEHSKSTARVPFPTAVWAFTISPRPA